jgi:hypothetical protein
MKFVSKKIISTLFVILIALSTIVETSTVIKIARTRNRRTLSDSKNQRRTKTKVVTLAEIPGKMANFALRVTNQNKLAFFLGFLYTYVDVEGIIRNIELMT